MRRVKGHMRKGKRIKAYYRKAPRKKIKITDWYLEKRKRRKKRKVWLVKY